MTDTTPTETSEPEAQASTELVVLNPVTGEALDLKAATTTTLAAYTDEADDLIRRLLDYRRAFTREVASRMDTLAARTERVGDWHLEVNAPTTETYDPVRLRAELEQLTQADDAPLDPAIIDRVIVKPEPKPAEERVAKAEVNKLKRSDDQRVLAAIARARTVSPVERTLKVKPVRPPA